MAVSKKGPFGDGTEFGDEQKKEEKKMKKEVYFGNYSKGPPLFTIFRIGVTPRVRIR